MAKKYKHLEDWKEELVGKEFKYLHVEDVVKIDGSSGYFAICKCKCGNSCTIRVYDLISGHNISCGCYSSSEENSRQRRIINSNNKELRSKSRKEWCKNNPDKVKAIGDKRSLFCKEHPDKVKEASDKYVQWCQNNPDKIKEKTNKYIQWYNDNPILVESMKAKQQEWHSDSDKVKEAINKRKSTFESNPNIQLEANKKISEWCKDNPDKVKESREKTHVKVHNNSIVKRSNLDYTSLLNIIHEDYKEDLLAGKLDSGSLIPTKCPICGEYYNHTLHNIFIASKGIFRTGYPTLCPKCLSNGKSRYESEIANIISEVYSEQPILNDRTIISPLELDLYYPNKRIAIEFNGTYWHSDKLKDRQYHFNKFKLCKEKNIRLVSIYEYEWLSDREKIVNLLKDIFGKSDIIYARKCSIRQLSSNERKLFIDKYHMDGDSSQGTVSYGLFYNDELISAMSFGKLRGQNRYHRLSNYYELVRFVNKSNVHIIGGASKLFKSFIREYNPKYILCYSDNDYFSGEVYVQLGFKLKSLGDKSIDYIWVSNDSMLSRQQCMPKKLLEQYPKYKEYNIKGSTEEYIMRDLGYTRVYRCGNSIWEWNNLS